MFIDKNAMNRVSARLSLMATKQNQRQELYCVMVLANTQKLASHGDKTLSNVQKTTTKKKTLTQTYRSSLVQKPSVVKEKNRQKKEKTIH